jgi:hypothetical protein
MEPGRRTIMREQFRGGRLLLVLAVAMLAAMLPAQAVLTTTAFPPQDAIPLTVTKPNEPVPPRTFQQSDEVQWFKITLKKGQDYAFLGVYLEDATSGVPSITVYSLSGKQLMTFQLTQDHTDIVAGGELRAPSTGTFYLKAVNGGPDFPVTYFVDVERDCREGPTTKCGLAIGRKPEGFFNFTGDSDWRRIATKAGQRYTVAMTVDISGRVVVRNRRGRVVRSCSADCQVKFRAAYTGLYYVVAEQEDEDSGAYTLGLTSP